MTPTIDNLLQEERYDKIEELSYAEMVPFIQREFRQRNQVIQGYIMLNIMVLVLMIIFGIIQIANGQIGFAKLIGLTFFGGTVIFILLVPIHEAIHGLAYKLAGAPKISFGGNVQQFYFYAVADKFVIGRKAFYIVALAPFIMITIIIMMLMFYVSVEMQWVLWGTLLMHTGACAGDFGMLSFYKRHAGEVYTFDDVKAGKAYFFSER